MAQEAKTAFTSGMGGGVKVANPRGSQLSASAVTTFTCIQDLTLAEPNAQQCDHRYLSYMYSVYGSRKQKHGQTWIESWSSLDVFEIETLH